MTQTCTRRCRNCRGFTVLRDDRDTAVNVDVAVLGAGCSGLAAACELLDVLSVDEQLLVLEARENLEDDRTWCGWGLPSHAFHDAVSYTWPKAKVRSGGEEAIIAPKRHPYRMIVARDYQEMAMEMLRNRAELMLGAEVKTVEPRPDGALDVVGEHDRIVARRVIDARWDKDSCGLPPNGLLQDFLGLRVRVDKPVFDPETATLMDFDVPQQFDPGMDACGVHFMYVLPTSPFEALVEPTFLGRMRLDHNEFRRRIDDYLMERYGVREYETLSKERGTIPMCDSMAPSRPGLAATGTSAGCVKPSSGYSFHAAQRRAQALARGWQGPNWSTPPSPRPGFASFLDMVFVEFLRQNPQRAPDVFLRLFKGVKADGLARFLSDEAQMADYAQAILAVPPLPMVASLARIILRKAAS